MPVTRKTAAEPPIAPRVNARRGTPVELPIEVSRAAKLPTRSWSELAAGQKRSRGYRATHITTRPASKPTLAPNSVVCGAISNVLTTATPAAKISRATRPAGTVFGSVIMKKRKIKISGDVTIVHQKRESHTGSNDQLAVMQ